MSFDLVVWRAFGQRFTLDEAARFYADLCERPSNSFVPDSTMRAFVDAVGAALKGDGNLPEDSPWAAPPTVDQDAVIMTFRWPLAPNALEVVRQMAADRGLVCFDPQASKVYGLVGDPSGSDTVSLELPGGRKISDPSDEEIDKCVRALSRERWFVILELTPGHYIQAGYGEKASAPNGQYALEFRDGSPERHWRTITTDLAECVRAFIEFRAGETDWTKRFLFAPLDPGYSRG